MALEAGGMGPSVQGLAEMSVSEKTGVSRPKHPLGCFRASGGSRVNWIPWFGICDPESCDSTLIQLLTPPSTLSLS